MIVGIDPSLSNTAVCSGSTADNWEIKCFKSAPIQAEAGKKVHARVERLTQVAKEIGEYLETLGSISEIYIEGYSMSSPFNREALAEFGFAIRCELIKHAPLVFEVTPTQLKKFTTGKGGGKKDLMLQHVAIKIGRPLETNDEVDAWALWRLGMSASYRIPVKNQVELDVIAGMLSPVKRVRKKKVKVEA